MLHMVALHVLGCEHAEGACNASPTVFTEAKVSGLPLNKICVHISAPIVFKSLALDQPRSAT
jgi:hypothetical protein